MPDPAPSGMNLLIVDDTRLAREELKTLLATHAGIDSVREADDIDSALGQLARQTPDLILLDIQLPGGTGFDLLERLDHSPLVIFTTAYDQFAVRAFEANALDYLVKPIDPARLAESLARVRQELQAREDNRSSRRPLLTAADQVFIRDGERCWFVTLEDISHFQADGNYVQVVFRGQRAMLHRSLSALEDRLDPALFFRASRSCLVNLRWIQAVDPWVNDGYRLTLKDGSQVDVSRRQAKTLRDRLEL